MTRRLAPALIALLLAQPLAASAQQERAPEPDDPLAEGLDLLGRGAEGVLRGLVDQIGPQLETLDRELRGFALELGPALRDLSEMIGDIDRYHPPERLPNGDIILRRKTPGEMDPAPLAPPAEGEVDI